ncbi:MAG: serine/threonine protein kinase [Pyrinomonadaceae bacterium]|nr:serine/threonine protein kinase [Pyrinomonadaceae bacterium]
MLAPDTILNGRYRIVRLLGKGGMGAVYEAIDRDLSCTVAVKENTLQAPELRDAFHREAKLLANLRHPSLPRVMHHFSQKDGQFLVMEFFAGKSLAEEMMERRNTPFPARDVLRWADILLGALIYLHNRPQPIIHSDIKPANLKLTPEGEIVLLDFGLARGKAGQMSSLNTGTPILGYSPNYSPLEQVVKADLASFNLLSKLNPIKAEQALAEEPDPRSDLYSLGATLYHLLTGQFPIESASRATLLWAGQTDPLAPAIQVNSQVTPEVSEVLARAMQLRPEDRFADALEMRQALREALHYLLLLNSQPLVTAGPDRSSQTGVPSEADTEEIVTRESSSSVRNRRHGVLGNCESSVRSVSFSPDGRFIASGSNDNKVRLWDCHAGQVTVLGQCDFHESGFSYVSSVKFSPDGKSIVSGSSDNTVRLWEVPSGHMTILGRHEHAICSVDFSPDGRLIASGGNDGSIHLWETGAGQPKLLGTSDCVVWAVQFSPDGRSLATESGNRTIQVWDIESAEARTLDTQSADVWSVAFSPDGLYIASGSWDQQVRIWNLERNAMRVLGSCDGVVRSVHFSPDGKLLACGSDDKTVCVWEVETGHKRVLGMCDDVTSAVEFSLDGESLASGSWDGTVRLWKVS